MCVLTDETAFRAFKFIHNSSSYPEDDGEIRWLIGVIEEKTSDFYLLSIQNNKFSLFLNFLHTFIRNFN